MRSRKIRIATIPLLLATLSMPVRSHAKPSDNPNASNAGSLVFIAVTDDDLNVLGKFPLDRQLYAQALTRLRDDGANMVVLKFFFDEDKDSDSKLAAQMKLLPTLVQRGVKYGNASAKLMAGEPEYVSARIADAAAGTGFVDARVTAEHDRVELFAIVAGKPLKSLPLLVAEAASGSQSVSADHSITIGAHKFEVDDQGRAMCKYRDIPLPKVYPLNAVLHGDVPAGTFSGKVAIIGYLASDSPLIDYSLKRHIKIHEVFYQQVVCLLGG